MTPGSAWDVRIVESDALGKRRYMYSKSRDVLYVPRGFLSVRLARQEARAIVRAGLADVLRWLGETP